MSQQSFDFINSIPAVVKSKPEKLTGEMKLFYQLLQGCYLMERNSRDGRFLFCLYEGKMNPLMFVKESHMKRVRFYMRWKKNRLELSRSQIRKLRGNHRFKRAYKQFFKQSKQ